MDDSATASEPRAQRWELLRESPAYDGYTTVRRDTYRLPDGSVSEWDVLEQGDTVAVVAITQMGEALLFEQYRVGPRALVRELPGGLVDAGESPLEAGARELLEETGYRAEAAFHAGAEWSGANSTRRKNVVIAAGCRLVSDPRWEQGETGAVLTIGFDALVAHLLSGELSDAGEALRGLLVFAAASVTDPVLREVQATTRDALTRLLRGSAATPPVDEITDELSDEPDEIDEIDEIDRFWERMDAAAPGAAREELEHLLGARGHDDARAAYERASLHDAFGEEEAAIPLYRAALASGLPTRYRTRATLQLASSLRNVGSASAAIALLREVAEDDPLIAPARAFLALALSDDGKPTAALRTALQTLAPELKDYGRAVDAYARELTAPSRIRAISVGLLIHDGRVLLESYPANGRHAEFLRVPGGGIEFGETAAAAVVREFREELDAPLDEVELLAVTENIYDAPGGGGHEIVHVYRVSSTALAALAVGARLAVRDSHTSVGWYDITALHAGAAVPPVYPVGVLDLLG